MCKNDYEMIKKVNLFKDKVKEGLETEVAHVMFSHSECTGCRQSFDLHPCFAYKMAVFVVVLCGEIICRYRC